MKALTARELAALSLPDLPKSERGIQIIAGREGWSGQSRAARGGGTEYPAPMLLKVLPEPARDALLKHLSAGLEPAPLPVPANNQVPATRDASVVANWQRDCADARAAILLELKQLAELIGTDRAVRKLVQMADTNELRPELAALVPAANARGGKSGNRHLSRATLYRWRSDFERDGWKGLIPQDTLRSQDVPAWAMPLLKLYRVPTKRSLAAVLEDLPAHLPAGVPMPSYTQANRMLRKLAPVERERGRLGPNALLQLKAFKRRSTEGMLPLDVVTADGHSFKADVAHPIHGKPFRPEVCAIIDTATRYCIGHSAGLAESAHVVMSAVRRAVSTYGLFNIFYSDNGSGFVGQTVTHETLGLFARIGATDKQSTPGRAQARGKVERFQHVWKDSSRKLVTYSGRDMDNEARRRVLKLVEADFRTSGMSRHLMPWRSFLDFCQTEIDAYNNRPHRSLPKCRDDKTGKLRHMSPAECLDQHRANGWAPRMVDDDILTDLFRPHVERTVARGEVQLPWGRYFHQRLVQFHGSKVIVAYDEIDDRRVYVRTMPDERLICIADKDGNVIPEQPQNAIEHARRRSVAASIKIIDRKRELKLAELGQGVIEHNAPSPMTPEQLAQQAALEAEFEQHGTIMLPSAASHDDQEPEERQRFRRALAIHNALQDGAQVAADALTWFETYQTGSEWRSQWGLYEDFGDAMFA